MANEQETVLTKEAFQSFEEDSRNSDEVAAGTFGIHEKVNGEWVTKTITEAEISNYKFAVWDEDFGESEEFAKLNENHHGYPCVEAV
jgi:hypothetical protein